MNRFRTVFDHTSEIVFITFVCKTICIICCFHNKTCVPTWSSSSLCYEVDPVLITCPRKNRRHNLMLPQTSTSMCQVPLSRAHDMRVIIIIAPDCKQWKHEWKHESQSYEFGQRSASATPPRRASSQRSGATYPRP